MRIVNFGSANIDYVYSLAHFAQPGETISCDDLVINCGGKGLNQSVALAKAGAEIFHAGMVGDKDGQLLLTFLNDNGVNTSYIKKVDSSSGHAIIQVNSQGENCIIVFGGANRKIDEDYVDYVLNSFQQDDIVLLQNEISCVRYIIEKAYSKGMRIALNPSPFNDELTNCDLTKISIFLLNEIEAEQLTGEKDEKIMADKLLEMYPESMFILTLGKKGAYYIDKYQRVFQGIYDFPVVDTTAAGDTYTGYVLSGIARNLTVEKILKYAAVASSFAVSTKGAAQSIPFFKKVDDYVKNSL